MLSRNEILHIAYNIVENPSEDIDPSKLVTSKVASLVFLLQLRRAEIVAYISRFAEFADGLDELSRDRLHTSTVNGLHGPLDYDHVVSLVTLMIELWNKRHAEV